MPTNRFAIGAAVAASALFVVTPRPVAAQSRPTDPLGKVVAVTGTVQHTEVQRELWNPARVLQPLFVAERVRTLAASRAAILFVDESQVKLNAGAVLTVHTVRRAGGPTTSLELERGEAWFRTKNPRSGLTIQTPAADAAVRGTEINIVVRPDSETVLTVVEGAAEFSNEAGSIVVNAGEEGTARPGQGKVPFTASSDLFVSLSGARSERGEDDDRHVTLGLTEGRPVSVRQFVTPDPRVSTRIDLFEGTLGYRQQWRPGSSLTAAARYTYLEHRLSRIHVGQQFSSGVADLEVGHEFAAKRGRVNLRVTNAFDKTFGLVVEGLSVDELLPRRRALLTMRWRVF